MADRATQVFNFYETTIANSDFSAGATSFNVASTPTIDGVNGITSATTGNANTWLYLVIDPDSTSNREIVVVKTHTSGSTTFGDVERDYDGRQEAAGAAADTGISHGIGTTVRMAVLAQHIQDQNDRVSTNITLLTTAISDFNTDGAAAIAAINASSATAMMEGATDGTAITVDNANDYILVYDNDTTTAKQVNLVQLPQESTKLSLSGGTMTGAIVGAELTDYVETDVSLSSTSGVVTIDLANGNTGSLTLTENITDIDFTNVPTNGVSSFTLKVTQDAASAYTVAINAITVNGGGDVTAKTAGAGGFDMTATLSAEDLLFFLFFDAGTPYLTAQQEMS